MCTLKGPQDICTLYTHSSLSKDGACAQLGTPLLVCSCVFVQCVQEDHMPHLIILSRRKENKRCNFYVGLVEGP